MNNDELIKKADIQHIADEGSQIYGQIKVNYEPKERGKFLAIEIESKKAYLGSTSAEAGVSSPKSSGQDLLYCQDWF